MLMYKYQCLAILVKQFSSNDKKKNRDTVKYQSLQGDKICDFFQTKRVGKLENFFILLNIGCNKQMFDVFCIRMFDGTLF